MTKEQRLKLVELLNLEHEDIFDDYVFQPVGSPTKIHIASCDSEVTKAGNYSRVDCLNDSLSSKFEGILDGLLLRWVSEMIDKGEYDWRQIRELLEEVRVSKDNQTGERKEIETSKRLERAGMKLIEVPATVEEYGLLEQFAKDKNLSGVEQIFQDYIDQIMQENFGRKPRKWIKTRKEAGVRMQNKHRRDLLRLLRDFHRLDSEFCRIGFDTEDYHFTFRDYRINTAGEVSRNGKELEAKDLAESDKYILREANDVLLCSRRLHNHLEAIKKELVLEKGDKDD